MGPLSTGSPWQLTLRIQSRTLWKPDRSRRRPGSHGVEQQRAVVPLRRRHDVGEQRQGALGQGTAGSHVTRDDLLVQAQLTGDAVERLRVQVQDGDRGGEGRRPEESPLRGETGGGERVNNQQEEVSTSWF